MSAIVITRELGGGVPDRTFGDRVVMIRQSIGGSVRGRAKQDAVAQLIEDRAGVEFDDSKLSRIESGTAQKFYEAVAILRALNALDPDNRGYDWLIGTDPLPIIKKMPKKRQRRSVVVAGIKSEKPGTKHQRKA